MVADARSEKTGAASAVSADQPVPTTEGTSIVALVLGVIGFFVPIVPSVLAIVFGKHAYDKIQADPSLEGAQMARAGEILGWTVLGLLVAVVLVVILFVPG